MDQTDLRLLRAIQEDANVAIAEIAKRAGLSHTPAWRRLKRLEEDGVICGRAVLLDASKLGLDVTVFAHIKLARHDEETLERFETGVCGHREILECFSMTGESDYVLRVVVRTIQDYEVFLKKSLLHLPGVSSVISSFALKKIKLTHQLPI